MHYAIGPDGKPPYDARIEVEGCSVILHSRGGATGGRPARNTDHGLALLAICRRAMRSRAMLNRVLIDSAPARRLPESERVLIDDEEISFLDADELARQIRVRMRRFGQVKGTKGGNSTKQVRFDFSLQSSEIIVLLSLLRNGAAAEITLLDAATQRRVTTLQIRHAVDRLLAGENAPNFVDSRDYDLLVTGGARLAPKKVFGLALEAALGIEMHPGHFKAGWHEPSFELLIEAGYRIVQKENKSREAQPRPKEDDIPPDPDDRDWAEGDAKLWQHLRTERRRDPAAAAAKRNIVRARNRGRLACENPACAVDWYDIFPTAVAESVFEIHHSIPVATMTMGHLP